MSRTVLAAFGEFREQSVDLDSETTKTARASRKYLFEQLKASVQSDQGFPRLTGDFYPFGSFARSTKTTPLNDIDLLIGIFGIGTSIESIPGVLYRYRLHIDAINSPLARFQDNQGYVNATKVLNKIKDGLSDIPNYRKADVKKTMEAVTLDLVSYPWVFDIVPAVPVFRNQEINYFLIPDGIGNWKPTDPRRDGAYVSKVNGRHTGQVLERIRVLKYWNNRRHKRRLPSYYFETIALKVFENAPVTTHVPSAVYYFFQNCSIFINSTCPDPKGLLEPLDTEIDWETKQNVIEAVTEAQKHSRNALQNERAEDYRNAIASWREIFGDAFPPFT